MPIKSIINALSSLAGIPHKDWLPENCKPLNLSENDISNIIEYLKKPKPGDYMIIGWGVIFFVIAVILEISFGGSFGRFYILAVGFIAVIIGVLEFLKELYMRKNNKTVNMLKLRQFTAFELPVTGKQRDRNTSSDRSSFCVMSGNRFFYVSQDEYRTIRGGQNAVAILFNLTNTVFVIDLRNLF
ncbi:MAG: hypothetical protein LBD23_15570 [Oscillospiraceae bacterium]|nr:hypothetical protein [Oscillospiraceae bacterium]